VRFANFIELGIRADADLTRAKQKNETT